MIIIPAIDIKNGKVVRLTQGKFDQEKIYDQTPLGVAKRFSTDGAKLIHIIDLDGAQKGEPQNLEIIKKIHKEINIPIQMGGGIRTVEMVEKVLAAGISRAVLGTRAIEDLDFLKTALLRWKERIAVSLDCANGFVATKGWTKVLKVRAITLIPKLEALGLTTLIYTDIATDGMLQGPNLKSLNEILKETKMKIIASGGISKLDDVRSLLSIKANNLYGTIIGKALYEQKFSLKDAINLC
ncbi:MAG: 1-(5-phosphoribosyl)-5-[(5-phosphoribosylamino)methylideneamino]imidazole-4-carboxamide isomerase [Candidatus Omnitrophica bacterium]|nr:1-(5-phosphoribosyl)-5-[(5-phosphoribosylamino)methylideneamino]imidazole-4-carboxamide isomerase [Candidatus Omnitrophota bacterium]